MCLVNTVSNTCLHWLAPLLRARAAPHTRGREPLEAPALAARARQSCLWGLGQDRAGDVGRATPDPPLPKGAGPRLGRGGGQSPLRVACHDVRRRAPGARAPPPPCTAPGLLPRQPPSSAGLALSGLSTGCPRPSLSQTRGRKSKGWGSAGGRGLGRRRGGGQSYLATERSRSGGEKLGAESARGADSPVWPRPLEGRPALPYPLVRMEGRKGPEPLAVAGTPGYPRKAASPGRRRPGPPAAAGRPAAVFIPGERARTRGAGGTAHEAPPRSRRSRPPARRPR